MREVVVCGPPVWHSFLVASPEREVRFLAFTGGSLDKAVSDESNLILLSRNAKADGHPVFDELFKSHVAS